MAFNVIGGGNGDGIVQVEEVAGFCTTAGFIRKYSGSSWRLLFE